MVDRDRGPGSSQIAPGGFPRGGSVRPSGSAGSDQARRGCPRAATGACGGQWVDEEAAN